MGNGGQFNAEGGLQPGEESEGDDEDIEEDDEDEDGIDVDEEGDDQSDHNFWYTAASLSLNNLKSNSILCFL